MFSLDTPLPVTVLPDVSLSLLLMMAIFFPYLFVSGIDLHESSKIAIIGLYVLFRMCEAISDLFKDCFNVTND